MTMEESRIAVLEAQSARDRQDIAALRSENGQILAGINEIKITLASDRATQAAMKDTGARSMATWLSLPGILSALTTIYNLAKHP